MRRALYSEHPRGCRFSTSTTRKTVPVVLEDLAVQGTRAQRRYALRELRKLKNKQASRP